MSVRSRVSRGAFLVGFVGAAALFGCGDSAGSDATDADGTGSDDTGSDDTGSDDSAAVGDGVNSTPADLDALSLGGFTVKLIAAAPATDTPAQTSVIGKVTSAPKPAALIWDPLAESGECVLKKPRPPFCDPECDDGVCSEAEVCVPHARNQSVGTVVLTGVQTESGESSITLEPFTSINTYAVTEVLRYPAFEQGDEIRLEAAGGDIDGFAMQTVGILPLELAGEEGELPVVPGEALPLRWTPGAEASVRIHVEIDISHHGGTRGLIVCDAEDDGELDVGAELVTGLIDLGVSGFPLVHIERRAVASVMVGDYRVDLVVLAGADQLLQVPGVTSCFEDDAACSDGETCQVDMQCG